MTNAILIDVEPLLLTRVQRVAKAHGWGLQQAMVHLLEHGLFACEAELAARFDDTDALALKAAIRALEQIQDDPGFALIGRPDSGLGVAGSADDSAGDPPPTQAAG